jgi:HSP20 family protein
MYLTINRYPSFANEILSGGFEKLFNTDRVMTDSYSPAMDIAEQENEYLLVLETPGVKKEDVKLNVEENVLTISGERKNHQLPEKASWIRNEIAAGSFMRTVKLSKNIDVEKISAELNDGILKITLPKAEAAKPRTININ